MANCKYCKIIRKSDPSYRVRRANWDLKSGFPRCAWHWQFVCDRCGACVSFHAVAWCKRSEEFFCIYCAPRHRKEPSAFWAWSYYYGLWCEKCESYHPALDWLEFKGMHPWQEDESARRALIGMSRKKELAFLPWLRWAPPELQQPTLDDMQQAWDKNAELCDAKYGEYGDAYRQYIFNPALFPMLGELKGKRVLDAGCGAGYLSRLMTKQGAQVTGIDLSKKFIEIAKRYETQNLLGIKYEQGDIADLSQFRSESFDLAVSVYVLCDTLDCEKAIHEIARVLIPGGDFIFLIAHPCFEWQAGGWERIPKDSQRSEDRPYFKVDQYFRRGTLECQWGNLSPLLTFHRPLSDYFHFLNQSGFLVKDLVEPRPVREALKELPHYWENENRIPPVLIIHAIKSNS